MQDDDTRGGVLGVWDEVWTTVTTVDEPLPGSVAKEKPMSKERTEEECCHHWLIERAVGLVSKGVCTLCGAEKEFRNKLSDCYKKRDKKD